MTEPAPGFRSLKELGVTRSGPRVGVDPGQQSMSLAAKAASLRETLTRAQLEAAQKRAGGEQPDDFVAQAGADRGVLNPYGSSSRAFEPNTEIFDQYAAAYGDVQNSKAKEAAAAQSAPAAVPGGGPGVSGGTAGGSARGVYDGQGKTQAFINAARSVVGKMYVWGGTSLATGTDCSGLIYAALKAAGVPNAKRYRAVDYRNLGTQVSAHEARPGDVVYIDNPNSDTDHVGIYIGSGQMIESPTSGQRTKISAVGNRATSYRRILNDDSVGRSLAMGGATTWLYNGRPWNVASGYSYAPTPRRGVFA